jgi:hypothetical protein
MAGDNRNLDAAQRGLLTNSLAPWVALIEEAWNRGPFAVHVSSMQGSGFARVVDSALKPT